MANSYDPTVLARDIAEIASESCEANIACRLMELVHTLLQGAGLQACDRPDTD